MLLAFNIFIITMLLLDLFVISKKDQEVSFKRSILWVGIWFLMAMIFAVVVYQWYGHQKAFEFITGYVIEWSLSVDNLFVFILIFNYFEVPKEYQYRVLFWGIIGAFVLRGLFIFAGVSLFHAFDWMVYVFGAILVYTGLKMLFQKEDEAHDMHNNWLVKWCRKLFPVSEEYNGSHFFSRVNGKLMATPLFLVLLVVDFTDLVFAVDSIPAVLSISSDSFIVYTSNVFAILGLRSLYFALAGMMDLFRYLKYGLSVILTFVGVKMIGSPWFHIPTTIALLVVLSVLAISVIASMMNKEEKTA